MTWNKYPVWSVSKPSTQWPQPNAELHLALNFLCRRLSGG